MQARTAALLVLALAPGCASAPARTVLDAPPAELTALAGEWHGEYSSRESGRNGSILFVLRPGTDSAYGEVLMVPTGYTAPRTAEEASLQIRRPVPEVLTIAFVHAEGGAFSGRLEPYRDPVCGCPLSTVFDGRFTGPDVISGTFTSTGPPMHPMQAGEWSVRRVRR